MKAGLKNCWPRVIELAVQATFRHRHTNYDQLLMRGVERLDARQQVRDKIDAVISRWGRVPVARGTDL